MVEWGDTGWESAKTDYKILYDYPPPSSQDLNALIMSTLCTCWDKLCLKDEEILLIEYPYLPLTVKDSIIHVLFQKFTKEISIIPQPISTVLSFGSTSGLVIDLGYLESRVFLVYDGRILENFTGFYPIGIFNLLIIKVERKSRI